MWVPFMRSSGPIWMLLDVVEMIGQIRTVECRQES